MAVFAAVITPTPDAMTMLFLWVPMSLLFELGIILVRMVAQRSDLDGSARGRGDGRGVSVEGDVERGG